MKIVDDVLSGVDDMLKGAKDGNFDEILNKTKAYAAKASKKGADGVELSRKKIDLFDARSKLSKAYEAFGKLQYEQQFGAQPAEEEVQRALAEIELQKTRADLLQEEIEAIKQRFSQPMKPEDK